jgi:hypothetical protein
MLLTHGFPPFSSANTDSNCCPRPAASHTSDAAASLARNRCTSRVSVAAAALAGPAHGLTVGTVGRLSCTGRLLAGRLCRWRWTGLPSRSNIAWHNQPMANAAMIKVASFMIYCIVIATNCLALKKMNKMRNQLEQMINGRKTSEKDPSKGKGVRPRRVRIQDRSGVWTGLPRQSHAAGSAHRALHSHSRDHA